MKEKEFNLSEKIVARKNNLGEPDCVYLEEDIKEFIKRLKEKFRHREEHTIRYIMNSINELAGDKLK